MVCTARADGTPTVCVYHISGAWFSGDAMSGFTKLVPEIVQSSVWNLPSDIRVVWITLLAVKDADGYIRGDVDTIARLANVPRESAEAALLTFTQPDPNSHTTDNEGRRIAKAPGGWTVLNHHLYRNKDRNEYMRKYMRKYRKSVSKDVNTVSANVTQQSASASVSVSEKEGCGEETSHNKVAGAYDRGGLVLLTNQFIAQCKWTGKTVTVAEHVRGMMKHFTTEEISSAIRKATPGTKPWEIADILNKRVPGRPPPIPEPRRKTVDEIRREQSKDYGPADYSATAEEEKRV